jgi:hypothetical protein
VLHTTLDNQRKRLEEARAEVGDYITPLMLAQR